MEQIVKPLPDTPSKPTDYSQKVPSRHASPKRKSRNDTDINHKREKEEEEEEEFEFFHKFDREKIKGVIHLITSDLKERGADVEYIMIPFRPEQTNEKLLKFLNQLFPMGNGQPVNKKLQQRIISKTEVWTLFQGLKYIWCRLPNSEIIGWKSYLEFKYREADRKFPQKAFLEIMPQCLESSNHASIVYDFFDLIVTLASNSKVNKMSARKISKMCAIWAFNKPSKEDSINQSSPHNLDFDSNGSSDILPKYKKINNTFQDGLSEWIPASDAMFHLLLAFLKSFVPKDLESAKLPRALKSILFNNEYPPKDSTAFTSETILTIPLVTLYTDKFSRKPWQLLEKCNELLDFSDYDAFEAREDYALLKSLFKKKNNVEGISRKMSQESRRLMKAMSTKHSTFQAGWAPRSCVENVNNLEENIQVKRVDIDDYFIWTWLSSLSYEETSEKKKIFGRSVILEFEFDGFKKWVCFQESDITLDYNSQSQLKDKTKQQEYRSRSASPAKSKKSNKSSPSSTKERKEPIAMPKIRDQSRAYDKFQYSNENATRMSSAQTQNTGQYHTTISLDKLNKNGKDNKSSFDKISKWNPLHNLRKKSNSSVGVSMSSSVYEDRVPSRGDYVDNQQPAIVSSNPLRDPSTKKNSAGSNKYELPPIETDDFKVDLPDINPEMIDIPVSNKVPYPDYNQPDRQSPEREEPNHTDKRHTIQSSSDTIEEINEMVENMISNEITEKPSIETDLNDPFKNVTKFDQYKPSAMREPDLDTSMASTVQSLKITSPQEAQNKNAMNYKQNDSNSTINLNKNSPLNPGNEMEHRHFENQYNEQSVPPQPQTQQQPYSYNDNVRNNNMQDNRQQEQQHYKNMGGRPPKQSSSPINDGKYQGKQYPQNQSAMPQQMKQNGNGRSHGQPMPSNIPVPHNDTNRAGNGMPTNSYGPPQIPGSNGYQNYGGSPSGMNNSPMRQGRPASPMRQDRTASPMKQGRAVSPVRQDRPPSPVRQGRAASPVRNNMQLPPQGQQQQYMGSPSPNGYYQGKMPVPGRSSSPMRMGYGSAPPVPGPQQQQQYPMMKKPQQGQGPIAVPPPQGQYGMMPPVVQSPSMQFNQQMSPQQRNRGFNQPMNMNNNNYGSPQFQQGGIPMPMSMPMGGPGAGYMTAPPNTIPMQIPHGGGNKLHGHTNKRQGRKQLYDNIRSGNFGI